jgi:Ser/Thr protein kinase RdoA (MazF antagonist)
VLHAVCVSASISDEDATVLQPPADNAMVALPKLGLVARIGVDTSHLARLRQELHVATWLAQNGLATPKPATSPPTRQLAVEQGRVFTWWEYLPSRTRTDLPGLMRLLRHLHGLRDPHPEITTFDPWARIAGQIAAAEGLAARDHALLRRRWEVLRGRWSRARWPNEDHVVIHGDAHLHNTLVYRDRPFLLDLEDVRLGPWQWDAISPLVHRRAGWISDTEYREAIEAYGREPADEPDIELLVSIRMLRMTCWLASRTGREPELVGAVRRRINTLQDSNPLGQWASGF